MRSRTLVKNALFGASDALGVTAFARWWHRRRLLVLCYHGVVSGDHAADRYEYRSTVSVPEFERQMRTCAELLQPVSAERVVAWLDGEADLPPRAVLVTFDDGYRNNLTLAAPVLERLGVPALVSVTTGYLGGDDLLWTTEVETRVLHGGADAVPLPSGGSAPVPAGRQERIGLCVAVLRGCKALPDADRCAFLDRLRAATRIDEARLDRERVSFLTWDDVRALHAKGMAIGSHTVSHPILTRVPTDRLESELVESRQRIEAETGAACPFFVYPNGGPEDVSSEVEAAVARAGYRVAFALMDGLNAERPRNRFRLDRIDVPGHVAKSVFGVRASGLHSRLAGRVDT